MGSKKVILCFSGIVSAACLPSNFYEISAYSLLWFFGNTHYSLASNSYSLSLRIHHVNI
jgi:hypothetical protein